MNRKNYALEQRLRDVIEDIIQLGYYRKVH